MNNYTPGPWTANLDSDHGDYVIWGPGDDEFVANMGTEPEANRIVAFDVSRANARLIAAAPDLLEACRFILAYHDADYSNVGRFIRSSDKARATLKLRAALAKAEEVSGE